MREGSLQVALEVVKDLRYSIPVKLGHQLEIEVEVLGQDTLGRISFKASVRRPGEAGPPRNRCSDLRLAFRDASGAIRSAWSYFDEPERPSDGSPSPALNLVDAIGGSADGVPDLVTGPSDCVLLPDELSGTRGLSMHSTLRYFERQRSIVIGGPEALKSFQDGGIQLVVGCVRCARALASQSSPIGDSAQAEPNTGR